MDKVISLHTVVFEFISNGEQLYCCVRKEDLDRFGEKCAFMHEVLKGVSDDPEEATDDFLIQCKMILTGGGAIDPTIVQQVTIH